MATIRVERFVASFPVVRQNISVENWSWQAVGACERAAALLLAALAAPVILAAAAAIWSLSGRAPFIAHRRVGWRGSNLWMLKLRTMWRSDRRGRGARGWIEFIEDDAGPAQKQSEDARVAHAVARFCRRHSIDELPQLWHVIRGEMLLVGPRPITSAELRDHYGAAADEVLQVKPGIAGLWQTSGRSRLSYAERLSLDLQFVRNRSLAMYVGILARAARDVWSGANAW